MNINTLSFSAQTTSAGQGRGNKRVQSFFLSFPKAEYLKPFFHYSKELWYLMFDSQCCSLTLYFAYSVITVCVSVVGNKDGLVMHHLCVSFN